MSNIKRPCLYNRNINICKIMINQVYFSISLYISLNPYWPVNDVEGDKIVHRVGPAYRPSRGAPFPTSEAMSSSPLVCLSFSCSIIPLILRSSSTRFSWPPFPLSQPMWPSPVPMDPIRAPLYLWSNEFQPSGLPILLLLYNTINFWIIVHQIFATPSNPCPRQCPWTLVTGPCTYLRSDEFQPSRLSILLLLNDTINLCVIVHQIPPPPQLQLTEPMDPSRSPPSLPLMRWVQALGSVYLSPSQ